MAGRYGGQPGVCWGREGGGWGWGGGGALSDPALRAGRARLGSALLPSRRLLLRITASQPAGLGAAWDV